MAPTVDEIKDDLKTYKGLQDSIIESAIRESELFLNGVNPDWKTQYHDFEDIWRYATRGFTLQALFPNGNYDSIKADAKEMVTSNWSSSFMQKRKSGFIRRID